MRATELARLAPRMGTHAAAQIVGQILSFVAGILVVRALGATGYAQYAIGTAVSAALLMLTDSGIGATLMAGGAKYLGDAKLFTAHYRAAVVVRWWFSVPIVAASGVWTWTLLMSNHSTSTGSIVSVILISLSVFASLDLALQQVVHRLYLRLSFLRSLAVGQALLRLMLTVGGILAGEHSPNFYLGVLTFSALAATLLTRLVTQRYLVRQIAFDRSALPAYRRGLGQTLPMVILLIAGEQAFLGLISSMGTTLALSQFIALSRFGVLFLVINSLVSDIAAPLVARAADAPRALLTRIAATVSAYGAFSALIIGGVGCFAPSILRLLGPRFQGLESDLVLVAIGYAIYNLGYCLDYLNQARGWLAGSWTYGPMILIWCVFITFSFNLRSLNQVALAFILQGVVFLLMQCLRLILGIRRSGGFDAR